MDALVAVVRDCIISREELPVLLNVVHPRPTRWHSIIEAVGTDEGVPLVEYGEWLRRLETAAENASGETIDAIVSTHICRRDRQPPLTPYFSPLSRLSSFSAGSPGLLVASWPVRSLELTCY